MIVRNKATQDRSTIEVQAHGSNLKRGRFVLADAIRLVDKWLADGLNKSDPFIRDRSISRLMNGVATPEDF